MDHPLFFRSHPLFPSGSLALSLRSASFDEGRQYCSIAVLAASGEYGYGSRGNPDARALRIAVAAAIAEVDPDALVLDFRELSYEWGDALLGAFEPIERWDREHPVGCVIASGPKSDAALASLLAPHGQRPSRLHADWDAAVAHAKRLAFERCQAIDAAE